MAAGLGVNRVQEHYIVDIPRRSLLGTARFVRRGPLCSRQSLRRWLPFSLSDQKVVSFQKLKVRATVAQSIWKSHLLCQQDSFKRHR
jgi:hypothetical protein